VGDNELGAFLRARRQAVTPAEVGLPAGPRRRTAGLRRAEVAMLAGVSVEYVTRLEQGRDRRPSAPVLGALADALRLGPTDRVHLYRLVKAADLTFSCMGGRAPARTVRGTVRALLDRLEPGPALVLNRLSEIVAHTEGYDRLARPLGLLDGDPPNLARYVFTDDRARAAFPDWDQVADEQVAALKEGPFRADPFIAALADELTVTAGPAFERRAQEIPGLATASGVTRLTHPEAGDLRLAYETLRLPADDDQRLLVYLPADPATTTALDRLAGRRPGALHAVTG
jgi:transcriptional regulator with XRE-family HTH domain